jgi:hypothetical protein
LLADRLHEFFKLECHRLVRVSANVLVKLLVNLLNHTATPAEHLTHYRTAPTSILNVMANNLINFPRSHIWKVKDTFFLCLSKEITLEI